MGSICEKPKLPEEEKVIYLDFLQDGNVKNKTPKSSIVITMKKKPQISKIQIKRCSIKFQKIQNIKAYIFEILRKIDLLCSLFFKKIKINKL